MRKDTAGCDVARFLVQQEGQFSTIVQMSSFLNWSAGYTVAVIRDMKHYDKSVELDGDVVRLTPVGVDLLNKIEM